MKTLRSFDIMRLLVVCVSVLMLVGGSMVSRSRSHSASAAPRTERAIAEICEAYGKLPLSFEANHGQANASSDFVARGAGYTFALSADQVTFALALPSANDAAGVADARVSDIEQPSRAAVLRCV